MYRVLTVLLALTLAMPTVAEDVELDVIHRIKLEAIENSKVMDYAFLLTDLNGPRLSGSPGHVRAAAAVVQTMQELEIDAEVQLAGKIVREWSFSNAHLQMLTPTITPLNGLPMAWSGGTDGVVRAQAILAPLPGDPEDSSDLVSLAHRVEQYKKDYAGKLTGKIVLLNDAVETSIPDTIETPRFDDAALAHLSETQAWDPAAPTDWPIWKFPPHAENERVWSDVSLEVNSAYYVLQIKIWDRLFAFLSDEGVAAILITDGRGDASAIYSDSYGSWFPGAPPQPPTLALTPEQYNRLVRLVQHEVPVEIEVGVDVSMSDDAVDLRNVVASIPGGKKRDEVVMLGAHLDSWHGAVGAVDNAAGCVIVMEAMRILKTLDLKMDRTVRMALWDGEEQNYYGSRAYVKKNFADPISMQTKPAHSLLSAYFNVDNGAGKLRGIYLQSNDMARPIFEDWFAPLADLGVDTVSNRATSETDHLAFDSIGLPGFQFIQDPLDYGSKTHHSNMDTVDHIVAADLKQAAAVLAIVIYHAANRDELMPRKPMPKPLPEPVELPEILH